MARSIESFEIRKFSKFVLVDSNLLTNVSVVPNTWYHYPYRTGLTVSFVEGKEDTTVFIYWRGSCLEKVAIAPAIKALCSFITHYPSIGFKQISLTGSILNRFQLSFLDKKQYNNCIKYLTTAEFGVTELQTRSILNNGSQAMTTNAQQDLSASTDQSNATSDLSLHSQSWAPDSQWAEDSQFDTSQVLPAFSTQIPAPCFDADQNFPISWDMFNMEPPEVPDFNNYVLGDYKSHTEKPQKLRFKLTEKKSKKKDWKSMSDKQLKEYIIDHLNNEDFIAFVGKIDTLLAQDQND